MKTHVSTDNNILFWRLNGEILKVEPWGPDGARVRATSLSDFPAIPGALLESPATPDVAAVVQDGKGILTNGKLRAEIWPDGTLHFLNAQSGSVLLEEPEPIFNKPPARWYRPLEGSNLSKIDTHFRSQPGEHIFGLGQHQHGLLDNKGAVIDLEQRNTEVCIPFYLSSLGYGFLWNNPGVGRVELGTNLTRWVMEATRGIDYYIVAGDTPAEILEKYIDATGHPPLLPDFALGFWQCKLRYRTEQELLSVVREYKQRGLPLAIIVSDYFHWHMMGDWAMDPRDWPDPAGMMKELKEMGVELMVSIWPTVNPSNPVFGEMVERGLLAQTVHGVHAHMAIADTTPEGVSMVSFYDATNPEAREFLWQRVKKNYLDCGVRVFWLDADEPELMPMHAENIRFALGTGLEVMNIYPLLHQKGFYDGMQAAGQEEIINLSRSAWAGTQRYGAAVWSGDVRSRFEVLRAQIPAGLNIAMSGIPWWTTDIGGFMEGDIRTDYFKELIVRWFQYGVFCPLFRLHGVRQPLNGLYGAQSSGAGNEVWSFGERNYEIIRNLLFLREKLKPYLRELNRAAHEHGTPPMRPLYYDFPADPAAVNLADQFMLGPDLLVAPVTEQGAVSRDVYLPTGTTWVDAWNGQEFQGGQHLKANAPLELIPSYWRKGSKYQFKF
ncbi:MAG TPA: glycoside hydrolase family 31 protein [Anaerolineales bacterium]|nr:glycoside hydrolase family 31 protein [Anaerolineales bacterium]